MLMDHTESKETSVEDLSYECDQCEKEFSHAFIEKSHTCIPVFKYPCEKCSFVAISVAELLDHLDIHFKDEAQCTFCQFITNTIENLKMHVIDQHNDSLKYSQPSVEDTKNKEIQMKSAIVCGQCGLNFESMELCKSHINAHSFKCSECEFESEERSEVN